MLAVPANELSVYELIGHFDDLTKSRFCLLGGVDCDARRPCLSHARWNRLVDRSIEPLRSTTIADLLAGAGDDLSPAETENGVALEPSLGPPPTRLTPSPGSNGNGRLPLVNSYQSRGR